MCGSYYISVGLEIRRSWCGVAERTWSYNPAVGNEQGSGAHKEREGFSRRTMGVQAPRCNVQGAFRE